MKSISERITPGPWVFYEQGDANEFVLLTNTKGWVIAFRQNGEFWTEQQRTNAKVIATCPEMLDIIERLANVDFEATQSVHELTLEANRLLNQLNK